MRTKLNKEEEIVLITKKHWLPTLAYPTGWLLFLIIISLEMPAYSKYFGYMALPSTLILFYKIAERNYNTWVVTNLRVIEETGILSRITTECRLDKINNISYIQNIWGRLFGFGNVVIQTAAQHGATIYFNVSRPKALKETITTMQEHHHKSFWKDQSKVMLNSLISLNTPNQSQSIGSEIEKLFELKQKGILSESEYESLKYKVVAFVRNVYENTDSSH